METGASRRLDEGGETERIEQISDAERQGASASKGLSIELRLRPLGLTTGIEVGIEVEDDEIGIVEHRLLERGLRAGEGPAADPGIRTGLDSREPCVQLETSHLPEPEERRQVLTNEILAVRVATRRVDRYTARECRRVVPMLLEEALAPNSVRKAGSEKRAAGQMG